MRVRRRTSLSLSLSLYLVLDLAFALSSAFLLPPPLHPSLSLYLRILFVLSSALTIFPPPLALFFSFSVRYPAPTLSPFVALRGFPCCHLCLREMCVGFLTEASRKRNDHATRETFEFMREPVGDASVKRRFVTSVANEGAIRK